MPLIPFPPAAAPSTFKPLNWGGDACDQMRELLATNERLNILFSWMFKEDGTLQNDFLAEFHKWVYGPLAVSGTAGNYILTSTPPYADVELVANEMGRVVFFIANQDSPATGATITLDGLPAVDLLNSKGQPIQEREIGIGQLVGAIFDGSDYRTFTSLSQSQTFALPGRTYGEVTANGSQIANFPVVMSITLTKPPGARWDYIDLAVHGHFVGSSGSRADISCDIIFDSGPSAATSISSTVGAGSVSQSGSTTISADSSWPLWRRVFEMPAAYQALNTVTFKATITLGVSQSFSGDTDILEYFVGTAHYLNPIS